MEQGWVLRDHGDVCTQRILRDIPDILSINQNSAISDIVKSEYQIDESGFPTSGVAYKSNFLTGFNFDGFILKKRLSSLVMEFDIVEVDLAMITFKSNGIRFVLNFQRYH